MRHTGGHCEHFPPIPGAGSQHHQYPARGVWNESYLHVGLRHSNGWSDINCGICQLQNHESNQTTITVPFSPSMVLLKVQGAECPQGSMATIFFGSAHAAKGPMLTAGSVLV